MFALQFAIRAKCRGYDAVTQARFKQDFGCGDSFQGSCKAAGAADGSATTRSASGSRINEVTPAKSKHKHNQQVDKNQTFPMQNPYLKKAVPEDGNELSDDPVVDTEVTIP